jgi:hypothetical protein
MRLGFAVGASLTLVYVGCVFVMATVPQDAAVRFFNSLLHGLDVRSIMRWDMPWTEMVIGIFGTFILGWLFAAVVAVLYRECGHNETVEPWFKAETVQGRFLAWITHKMR